MNLLGLLRTNYRILTFQATGEELSGLGASHLFWGLLWTWIVGVGRYWDHPNANLFQYFGVGSLLYVFLLSGILWMVIWPLRPSKHSLLALIAFVTMVSPPALLYAIPVEKFLSFEGARSANAWFLGVVAFWRLSLYFFFLRRSCKLTWPRTVVGALLPMVMVVASLTYLNLEKAVFNIMGGFQQATANDSAYIVLLLITFLSAWLFPVLLIAYIYLVIKSGKVFPKIQKETP